jgi:hypothetical protein
VLEFVVEKKGALGGCGAGWLSDDCAGARTNFEQAFIDQMGDHFMGGVRVDLQRAAEDAHRRKRIAGAHLAGDDRLPGGVDYLFVQRHAGLEGQAERNHMCTITGSTAEVKLKTTDAGELIYRRARMWPCCCNQRRRSSGPK